MEPTKRPWKVMRINGQIVVVPDGDGFSDEVPICKMQTPFNWQGGNVFGDEAEKLQLANANLIVDACNKEGVMKKLPGREAGILVMLTKEELEIIKRGAALAKCDLEVWARARLLEAAKELTDG